MLFRADYIDSVVNTKVLAPCKCGLDGISCPKGAAADEAKTNGVTVDDSMLNTGGASLSEAQFAVSQNVDFLKM
jgi:hypothetical protein